MRNQKTREIVGDWVLFMLAIIFLAAVIPMVMGCAARDGECQYKSGFTCINPR